MSVVIGIDPGKNTGTAVRDLDTGELLLATLDFWSAYDRVRSYPVDTVAAVVIEVPSSKAVFHQAAATARANQRMGVNVGSVLREAELLAVGLERSGYRVKRVEPVGKRTQAQFEKLFPNHNGRTNQHTRDAAIMTLRIAGKSC